MDPVIDHLEALGVEYEVVPCDPELADTAAFCEAYGFSPDDSANAILVVGKAEARPMACCLVLASTRLDVNGTVRKRLGTRKASFAGAEETIERSGGGQGQAATSMQTSVQTSALTSTAASPVSIAFRAAA